MYPTTRQMTDMPNEAIQAMTKRYGEYLPILRAQRARNKAIRQAIDEIEHCCPECDWLDEMRRE